jgi:hypothetical protein
MGSLRRFRRFRRIECVGTYAVVVVALHTHTQGLDPRRSDGLSVDSDQGQKTAYSPTYVGKSNARSPTDWEFPRIHSAPSGPTWILKGKKKIDSPTKIPATSQFDPSFPRCSLEQSGEARVACLSGRLSSLPRPTLVRRALSVLDITPQRAGLGVLRVARASLEGRASGRNDNVG